MPDKPKNAAAVALGKRAAKKLTPEIRARGGHSRKANLSPERLSEIAQMGVAARAVTMQARNQKIDALQKKHPGTRRQRSSHGAGKYSVQFFDKKTGELVADYIL